MLACSFLIESSSKLLVSRTGIKAWSSSILGRIRQLILELLAFGWWKFQTFELEYIWSQLANLDQILYVASLGWGKGCIRFWGRLTLAHWTQVSDRCLLGYLFYVPFPLRARQTLVSNFWPNHLPWIFWAGWKKKILSFCWHVYLFSVASFWLAPNDT